MIRMIDTTFLSQLKRFNLIVSKRVTSNYTGPRKSYAQGHGMIFKDHRIYTRGDDYRAIDWKVYARTDDLFIKNYEEERSLTVHILVDSSASMDFGKPFTKFEYASMIGVGFAYLTLQENEKFRFTSFNKSLNTFRQKRGKGHLAEMVYFLNNFKPEGKGDFREMMDQYRKSVAGRSMVVIISDFLDEIESIKHGIANFSKQELKVIQVLDRVEKDMLLEGDLKLHDLEDKSVMRTFISNRLREEYKRKMSYHSAQIGDTAAKLGGSFFQAVTDEKVFDAFHKMMR